MQQQVPLREMLNQSIQIFTHPHERTFQRYSLRGNRMDAAIYVGLVAFLTGLLSMLANPMRLGVMDIVMDVIITLLGFFFFAAIVWYVGNYQGGRGSFEEIVYTFALFHAPITLVFWLLERLMPVLPAGTAILPWLSIINLLLEAFFTYLAVQASMRFQKRTTALITMGVAVLILWLISVILP
jgi:apolipoprotein N-acyltransferase